MRCQCSCWAAVVQRMLTFGQGLNGRCAEDCALESSLGVVLAVAATSVAHMATPTSWGFTGRAHAGTQVYSRW